MARAISVITLLLLSTNILTADKIIITAKITFKQEELDKLENNRKGCPDVVKNLINVVNGSKDLMAKIDNYSPGTYIQRKETYDNMVKQINDFVQQASGCGETILAIIKKENETFLNTIKRYSIPEIPDGTKDSAIQKHLRIKDKDIPSAINNYKKTMYNSVVTKSSRVEFDTFNLKAEQIFQNTEKTPEIYTFEFNSVEKEVIIFQPSPELTQTGNQNLGLEARLDLKLIFNDNIKPYTTTFTELPLYNWKFNKEIEFNYETSDNENYEILRNYLENWKISKSQDINRTLSFDTENKTQHLDIELFTNSSRILII